MHAGEGDCFVTVLANLSPQHTNIRSVAQLDFCVNWLKNQHKLNTKLPYLSYCTKTAKKTTSESCLFVNNRRMVALASQGKCTQ